MTVYSADPAAMIGRMAAEGARDFHVIDLDGARTGKIGHRELIRTIRGATTGYLEVGGGIRAEEDIASYTRGRRQRRHRRDPGADGPCVF